jgi:3-hydroxybutyrate dehydrogenase
MRQSPAPSTNPAGQACLSGRVALITGGNKGIGKAIALELAKAGASVAIGSRHAAESSQLAKQIDDLQVPYLIDACDVRDESSLQSFVSSVQQKLGKIDILVNNAGIYRMQPVHGHDLSIWKDVVDTNLTGAMLASRAVIGQMQERQWGRIINIASISGQLGEMNGSAYSASKFGLIGFTQSLALESAKHGVTVNAVCPGWVLTDMSKEQSTDESWCQEHSIAVDESIEIARLSVPQMRFIEVEEIAALVVYLCSDAARGITGQAINVCGGLSLH